MFKHLQNQNYEWGFTLAVATNEISREHFRKITNCCIIHALGECLQKLYDIGLCDDADAFAGRGFGLTTLRARDPQSVVRQGNGGFSPLLTQVQRSEETQESRESKVVSRQNGQSNLSRMQKQTKSLRFSSDK